ncbi:TonB-dependent receptor [uncultured Desulfobacter sp.]|uniref:TonB-dependent receptor n=1 Tax=uncultured Desulfobacter sp. TaxID=240139 RepID=UPI0029F48FC5|nr:TonB-dependent receptor [uncultured Desulfobacter sp.]
MSRWLKSRTMKKSLWVVVWKIFMIGWVCIFFQPCISQAQDMDTKSIGAKQNYLIETITVTAQKQEENVQEVPISISVLNGQAVEDKGIQSVRDLADFTPNLVIFEDGMSDRKTPSMRGIYAATESFSTSTGLYIDGVPFLSSLGYEDGLLDIERIEVLRGPQGTVYGKNTEAGAINIITRRPDNEFRGKISTEIGRFLSTETGDGLGGTLAVNLSGPLSKDRLFASLSGKFYQQEGFIENISTGETANDKQDWFGRGNLRWTPTDQLDVSLIASCIDYNNDGPNMGMSEQGAAAYYLLYYGYRLEASDLQAYNDSTKSAQSLKVEYDVTEKIKITSITARTEFNDVKSTDFDFSQAKFFHSTTDYTFENISQELRLNYTRDRLKWLIGIYYDNNSKGITGDCDSDYPSMVYSLDTDAESESWAAFTNLTYPLFTKVNIVAGVRYEYQEGEINNNIYGMQDDQSWSSVSPKLSLDYMFSPEIMSYISASKGVRSGGFNIYATAPAYYSYDDEELWSYELGVKTTLFDNRLIVNSAVYYMDIDNMQVNEAVAPNVTYLTNAAKANGYGFELEATAQIRDGLSLMAGFGFNHVEFDEFNDADGDYAGNKNPYAPQYTFNVGVQYRHHNGLYFRADLIGKDKMYLDKTNTYTCDAHQIVNVKIGYETERFDIYLFGRNIFDEEYDRVGASGGYYTAYSNPGKIGLTVNYHF